MVCSTLAFGQNRQDYYVVVKPAYSLDIYQKIVNPDQTLTLDLADNNLEAYFNSKAVYYIDKAFPTATTPYLQRAYKVTLNDSSHITDILNRPEIEYVELVYEGTPDYTPNDFDGVYGTPMSQLDLISARQAWEITQGDPSIIVGIVDTDFEASHEDLTNQIILDIDGETCLGNKDFCGHGTWVSGIVAAQTDNGIGISGIGFNTKLITRGGNLSTLEVLILSQIPGVRIISGSFSEGCEYSPLNAAVYEEIWNSGVTVIVSAGNGNSNCGNANIYRYPGSYDYTISVSSVGHVFPVGTNHPTLGRRDWKDVHEKTIGDANTTHQHNDKVDLVAPGYHMTSTASGNTYVNNLNGTSFAAPTVSGVAALMLAVNPNLTPDEIRFILKSTADDIYQIPENAPYIGLLGTGEGQCI